MSATPSSATVTMTLANEQATARLAADLAAMLDPGDVVTLAGDLGAGKTTLARALIRRLAGDPAIEVPSPTFTLMQSYELPRFTLVHADFYRVSDPSELAELGFDDLPEGAVVLLEWPDRAADRLPPDRLDIVLTVAPARGIEERDVTMIGHGTFASRAERLPKLRAFLDTSGHGAAQRQRLTGDASTRAYERLSLAPAGERPDESSAILMIAPRRPDGPPVKRGLPYSAIAHLAEDVKPFVAMANGLRMRGFSAPAIFAADLDQGFLLLEDFGAGGVVEGDPPGPMAQRYRAAVDVLVALHALALPERLPVTPEIEHAIPPYDLDAFLIEIELLLAWYLPHHHAAPSTAAHDAFLAIWGQALGPALAAPKTWVLRDFHSPNLMWLPEREGIAQVGLLDFQDALIGPAAYDLASLLQDARVDVPEELELELLGRYVRARRAADPGFDLAEFAMVYATLAAQRASKILGIFARLDKRDGKPQYLRHLPRIRRYLQRALGHPALAPLKAWYDVYLPRI